MALSSLFGRWSTDLAIDLGTANTLVYIKGAGVVCDEPSMVAVKQDVPRSRRVVAIGAAAKEMLGRTPSSICVIRPLKDGAIVDLEGATEMLRHFIGKARHRSSLGRPRVVICVPSDIPELNKRTVREIAEAAGARAVHLVEAPLAAAIGVGLPIAEPSGSMIVQIGGGTATVAVLSLCGLVYSHSVAVAGDRMDHAIIHQIKRKHHLQIGEYTAEFVKITVGSVSPDAEPRTVQIGGRDIVSRAPKTIEVNDGEIRQALVESLGELLWSVRVALDQTPPELLGDILERGIVLAGGGALLRNLDCLLRQRIGLPIRVADEPRKAGILGAGALLNEPSMFRQVATS